MFTERVERRLAAILAEDVAGYSRHWAEPWSDRLLGALATCELKFER